MIFSNFNIDDNADNYEKSETFDAYGRVDVVLGENENGEVVVVSYPDVEEVEGQIMTVEMPMCTDTTLARTAAMRIYNSLLTENQTVFRYVPHRTTGAIVDPSIEFGDGIDVNGVHSGFHSESVTLGRLMKHDLASPADEEIDHEYPYETSEQRQITRTRKEYKARLSIAEDAIVAEVSARVAQGESFAAQLAVHAEEISAKVTADTSSNSSTFGWKLTSNSWEVFSGGSTVLKATASGLEISGKITATSGKIGGFTIGSNAIYNNISSFGGTQSTGVYLGTNGIQLGQNFKVDTSGNVTTSGITATSIKLKGTLSFLNADGSLAGTMSAADLRLGAHRANNGYSSWNSAYASTTSGGYCYGGASGYYAGVAGSSGHPASWTCTAIYTDTIRCSSYLCPNSSSPSFDLSSHHHSFSVSGGKVTIGEPQAGAGSFNIADTQYYKDGVSAAKKSGASGVYVSSVGCESSPTVIYPDRVKISIVLSNGKTSTFYRSP